MKLASINLRKLVLSPTGSINLGFILREDLLLCSSYLPLGVPNWADIYTPSHILTSPFRLFNSLDEKTLRPQVFSRKHTASRRHHRCEIGRVQKLFPAPCRRGESPPEAFFITMPASGVMCK
jgi:hypothetical protein